MKSQADVTRVVLETIRATAVVPAVSKAIIPFAGVARAFDVTTYGFATLAVVGVVLITVAAAIAAGFVIGPP